MPRNIYGSDATLALSRAKEHAEASRGRARRVLAGLVVEHNADHGVLTELLEMLGLK